ncbi:MAG: FadR family transcriptional regulator [Acidobacteria bacterium]|nr:FadR family transcriptional regulator [Acidobacteriota bacterium]
MLKTVPRDQTLTVRAQQQLEDLILDRELQSGERLPSEMEMGRMLGVSRTVVREAVRLLSAKGLVEARTGSGVYVKGLGSSMIRDPMNLLLRSRMITAENIVQVREMMEVRIAGLAAEMSKPEQIAKIEKSVRMLSKGKVTADEAIEADLAFHNGLAEASGNPLMSVLSNSINDVMAELHLRTYKLDAMGSIQDSIFHHSRILDRVKAHDAEGARRAMEEHLASSREWTRRVTESLSKSPSLS